MLILVAVVDVVAVVGVGVVGAVFLGYIQDTSVEEYLGANNSTLHAEVITEKQWVFGTYNAVDPEKVSPEQADTFEAATNVAKKGALATVAIFPCIMLVCYLLLIGYFRSKGGYKPVELDSA